VQPKVDKRAGQLRLQHRNN